MQRARPTVPPTHYCLSAYCLLFIPFLFHLHEIPWVGKFIEVENLDTSPQSALEAIMKFYTDGK